MTDPSVRRLVQAADAGDLQAVQACLAAGADPNARLDLTDWSALDRAAHHDHASCIQALLKAGADPNLPDRHGEPTALFKAVAWASPACVEALLAAGADAWAVCSGGRTPVHLAVHVSDLTVLRLLLQADPAAAASLSTAGTSSSASSGKGRHRRLAPSHRHRYCVSLLITCLSHRNLSTARCVLTEGPLQPAGELLQTLKTWEPLALPLYADVASRQPLTAEEWARVPTPCPGLGQALPAVLQRSAEEAALLVRHLPAAEGEHLRVAALCLARAQRQLAASLPDPITGRILALSVAAP